MSRVFTSGAGLFACALALAAACSAEEPVSWAPSQQRAGLAGSLDALLGTRGFKDPERGEAILVRGEQLQGLLRGTLELRTLGGMREERLVLQSDVRLSDGAFVALRFLLVRGASRVRGEAQIVDGKLTGSVTQLDAQGAEQPPERFERAWDPSAQPLSWALAFYPLLRDAAGPTLLRGRIYHGVEQALAPELAELAWTLAGDERTLSVKGALPGERVARAGVKGGALAWLELGDGGRALPLPAAEVERMVAAQPVSLE